MAQGTLYHLPTELLLNALRAWGIDEDVSIEPLSGGFSADVWKLQLPDEKTLVAKFVSDTRDGFETQLRTAERLADHGLPTPRPIRTASGELCVMAEGPPEKFHPLGLMTFVPGRHVENWDDEIQTIAGRLLAEIHRAMEDADFVSRDPKWFYSYLEDEEEPVAYPELVRPITRETLSAVRTFEAEHEVTKGIVLGDDLHVMRDSETGSVGVIDLGNSILGPLAADVAITQLEIEGRGFPSDAFVNSYFASSKVTGDDRLALALYARMRLVALVRFFAWRVLHASTYQPSEREANEQRFRRLLQRLERPQK